MKLNDETVLEGLRLEPADLSSGRRFVKESRPDLSQDESFHSTSSVLQFRGFFSNLVAPQPEPREAGNDLPIQSSTRLGQRGSDPVGKAKVVWVPVVPLGREGFDVLQKFEGTVCTVGNDSFIARLLDRTDAQAEEEAEFPMDEVSPGDRELVKPGAMFYWVIGYRREAHGQLSRSSVIRFQRIPSWSAADVDRAKKEAETLLSFLDTERANNPA